MWLLALVIVTLAFLLAARRMARPYRYGAALALLGHVFVAVALLPRVPYNWDISKFHASALTILGGGLPEYATTVTSFATFQSLVYTLTTPDPIALSIVNGFMAVLLPFPLQDLLQRLYPGLRETHVPTLVVLFLPLPFVMLTIPMRDSLTVLVFATLLALLVRSFDESRARPGIIAMPLWGLLYLLRPELSMIVLVGIGASASIFVLDRILNRTVSLTGIVVSIAPFGLLGFALFASLFPIRRLNTKVTYRAQGGAVYLDSFEYASWFDVLLSAPGRAIYFQFAPFPLHVEQVFHLFAVFSLPLLIVFTLAAIASIYDCETDRTILVLLGVVYLAGVVGYGLIDSNFGTTARHRIPFVLLLIVFAAPALDDWWLRLRRAYNIP